VNSFTRALYRAFSFIETRTIYAAKEKVEESTQQAMESFNWRDAVFDAVIIGGLNFFTTLSSMSILQIKSSPLEALLAGTISFGLGFFTTLAVKRGLRKT